MIVNKKTMEFQTRSDKPNENWLKDDNYVVINDNSELADIVIRNYPFISLEISDNVVTNVIVNQSQKAESERKNNILNQIEELKKQLSDTDYKAIKHSEGLISDNDYKEIKEQRQEWRNKINELELNLQEN